MLEVKKRTKVIWKPSPKQGRFLSCPAMEVLYGGAAGGGKSDALLIDALTGLGNEGYKGLLLMRKFVDLERSLILRSHELYRGRGEYDGKNKRWKFAKNCSIEFGHIENNKDLMDFNQAQYHFVGIDDLTRFQESQYTFLFARVRSTNPAIRCKVRACTNPGGIGHAWVKKRFWIDDDSHPSDKMYPVTSTVVHPDGSKEDFTYQRAFIPALVYDNEHIMKNDRGYLMRLMELPEDKRKALLNGRWDAYEGQFFKEWDKNKHIIKPFPIPTSWRKSIAFDWGYGDPTCVLWFAESPDGTVYCYRELKINETIDIKVMKMILDMNGNDEIYCIYYPWDLDNKNPQTGVSMHERMDDASGRRFFWKVGNKSRNNGWSAVRHLLAERPDGKPRLQFFENCSYVTATIPEQVFDEGNKEDLDTGGDDHGVDALRYFAATFRALPELERMIKMEQPRDLGGAVRLLNGETRFKLNEPQKFDWMVS